MYLFGKSSPHVYTSVSSKHEREKSVWTSLKNINKIHLSFCVEEKADGRLIAIPSDAEPIRHSEVSAGWSQLLAFSPHDHISSPLLSSSLPSSALSLYSPLQRDSTASLSLRIRRKHDK